MSVQTQIQSIDPDLDVGRPGTYEVLITLKDMMPGDRFADLYKAATWNKHFKAKFHNVEVIAARPAVRYRDGIDTFTNQRGNLPNANSTPWDKIRKFWQAATDQDWFDMNLILTIKVGPGAGEIGGNQAVSGMGIAPAAAVALTWSIVKITAVVLVGAGLLYAIFSDHGMVIVRKVIRKVIELAKEVVTGFVDAAKPLAQEGIKNLLIIVGIGAFALWALNKSKARISTGVFGIG